MKTLDIGKTVYTVSDFVAWEKNKTLVLSPSFQRRPVWRPGAKSFLIDTILRGLPMPIIFLRDQKTDLKTLLSKREVVDGQQRIRTVLSYVYPDGLRNFNLQKDGFTLKRVHNKDLADLSFEQLNSDLKQRILDYQFSVHVLPANVDDREVLQIFARMNATGVKLNEQELRNADFSGEFKTLSYELAAEYLEYWRKWGIFTEYNIARMNEVELTSEFFMLMLRGAVLGKTQASINSFYKTYDEEFEMRDEVERRFRHVLKIIDDKLGSTLNVLPFKKKTLFYSLFAAIYQLAYGLENPIANKARPKAVTNIQTARIRKCGEDIQSNDAPENVKEAMARRTTHQSSRKIVIEYVTNSKL
jgi:uncharacterized protein with ParB-like and HNH nuclease domain